MLIRDGIPEREDLEKVMPSAERLAQGPVAITECFQNIACNPCTKACPRGAIRMEPDINATPKVDVALCNGCGSCILRCPGLAIFVVDMTYSENTAAVKIPFEFIPRPEVGQYACGLNRAGEEMGWFKVLKIGSGGKKNMTYVITLEVPKELAMEVRNIKVGGYRDGE